MSDQKKIVILAGVDIEKAGDSCANYPVVSVGITVTDINGVILDQFRVNFKVNWYNNEGYGDFEPRCVNEYWTRKVTPQVLEICKTNAFAPEIGWSMLNDYLLALEQKFPELTHKIVFLSDNASYDIANIDYNLNKYLGRNAMRYSTTGKYRSIKAADDMLDMASPKFIKEAYKRINSVVKHDHDPVNDAHFICLQYVEAMRFKNLLESLF